MIDFEHILHQAERETALTTALTKAAQVGIVYGVLRQTVLTYSQKLTSAEVNSIALQLTEKFLASESARFLSYEQVVREEERGEPKPLPRSTADLDFNQMTPDDIRAFAKRMNFTEEETEALIRTSGMMTVDDAKELFDPGVVAPTDDDMVKQEEDDSNTLNGVAGFSGPPPDYANPNSSDNLFSVTS